MAVAPSLRVASFLDAGVFLDTRGESRALRVRSHPAEGVVVLSLWRGAECTGTFRLAAADAERLVEALRAGGASYDESGRRATPAAATTR